MISFEIDVTLLGVAIILIGFELLRLSKQMYNLRKRVDELESLQDCRYTEAD